MNARSLRRCALANSLCRNLEPKHRASRAAVLSISYRDSNLIKTSRQRQRLAPSDEQIILQSCTRDVEFLPERRTDTAIVDGCSEHIDYCRFLSLHIGESKRAAINAHRQVQNGLPARVIDVCRNKSRYIPARIKRTERRLQLII